MVAGGEVKITCRQLLYIIVTIGRLFVMTCDLASMTTKLSNAHTSLEDPLIVPFTCVSVDTRNTLTDEHFQRLPQLAYSFDRHSQRLESISFLNFILGPRSQTNGLHFRGLFDDGVPIALSSSETQADRSWSFSVPPETHAVHVKLGATGCRAIWMEKNLESDDERIMRLSFDPSRSSMDVSVLLPPVPDLPFKPNECRSMDFDDIVGRVCIGLYNGDIYVLDYC